MSSRNRALLYIRKSVVRTGADTISPARQRAACLAEAARHGWVVEDADVYADAEGHSSGRTEHRADWQRLRARLRHDDTVAAVIVESLSRASRSVQDFFAFVEELRSLGVGLVSLKERFDTSNAMGQALLGFIAVVNQLESDLASERMKGNIAFKKAAGRHWGGTPFGCARAPVTGALSPSPETYVLEEGGEPRRYYDGLVQCYTWYASGAYGQKRLATALNAAGWRFRSRQGTPRLWDIGNVRGVLLAHPLYGGQVATAGHMRARPAAWVPGNFAPILPTDLCAAVAAQLAVRSATWSQPLPPAGAAPGSIHLLRGVLFCAGCGARLHGGRLRGKRFYRHADRGACREQWVAAPPLEAEVLGLLGHLALDLDLLEQVAELLENGFGAGDADTAAERAATARALARVETELARLVHLAISTDLALETTQEHVRALNAEAVALRSRQTALEAQAYQERVEVDEVQQRLHAVAGGLAGDQPEVLRDLVQSVFARIAVAGGRVVSWTPRPWCRPFF
ncbi:MAG: recombinase family protein [Anaerolineae bacterium]